MIMIKAVIGLSISFFSMNASCVGYAQKMVVHYAHYHDQDREFNLDEIAVNEREMFCYCCKDDPVALVILYGEPRAYCKRCSRDFFDKKPEPEQIVPYPTIINEKSETNG